MLNSAQRKQIKEEGFAVSHDFLLCSLTAGEPFLDEGVISYFDGRLATICWTPLAGDQVGQPWSPRQLVRDWIEERGAEGVIFVGASPANLSFLKKMKFRQTIVVPRRPISAELAIDTSRDSSVFESRVYRHSSDRRYTSRLVRGGAIHSDHLRLLESFFRNCNVSGYLLDLASSIAAILSAPWCHVLEARERGTLAGLTVFSRPFAKGIDAFMLIRRPDAPRVADFLAGRLLDHAQSVEVEFVNVGSSTTSGQFAFKRKWGATELVQPYYYTEWVRGQLSLRTYSSWHARVARWRS